MIGESAVLYPSYAVTELRALWGKAWRHLVDHVTNVPAVQPEAMAFTLMIRRVRSLSNEAEDKLYDDLGCARCATRLLADCGSTERELLEDYRRTLDEVKTSLASQLHLVRQAA